MWSMAFSVMLSTVHTTDQTFPTLLVSECAVNIWDGMERYTIGIYIQYWYRPVWMDSCFGSVPVMRQGNHGSDVAWSLEELDRVNFDRLCMELCRSCSE
ncbi:uncharacterized protein BDR25DRAFT_102151 [Lindgomyces ingoldianus]|uniref:Uncharacterized protein n=1 Tax=Lindgomyces ingoldianus TaxID=673940 RepID=A0ACB6R858_9PLEO|nr:uncharacterized protein BDR25DRAFT_102151 [Lindgomyces ingoldianus]KAF2475366.1 hypothetical protein BDR25DRAFT_102151 [Lindgomyces ingoldianus]